MHGQSAGAPRDFEDYYDLLDVSRDADDKAIESAVREMVKRHHPDTDGGDPELFQHAGRARETLIKESNREQYNELGHAKYVQEEYGETAISSPTGSGDTKSEDDGGASANTETTTTTTAENDASPSPASTRSDSGIDVSYDWRAQIRQEITTNAPTTVWERYREAWSRRFKLTLLAGALFAIGAGINTATNVEVLTGIYDRPPAAFASLLSGLLISVFLAMTTFTTVSVWRELNVGSPVRERVAFSSVVGGILLCGVGVGLIAFGTGGSEHPLTAAHQLFVLDQPPALWSAGTPLPRGTDALLGGVMFGSLVASIVLLVRGITATIWNDRYVRGRYLLVPLWEVPAVAAGSFGVSGLVFGPVAAGWLPITLTGPLAMLVPTSGQSAQWFSVAILSVLGLVGYGVLYGARAAVARRRDMEDMFPS